jgi:hypothetical protein
VHRRDNVTFVIAADPPRLSHLCVHRPGLDTADNLALVSFTFQCGRLTEYFLYRAAANRRYELVVLACG